MALGARNFNLDFIRRRSDRRDREPVVAIDSHVRRSHPAKDGHAVWRSRMEFPKWRSRHSAPPATAMKAAASTHAASTHAATAAMEATDTSAHAATTDRGRPAAADASTDARARYASVRDRSAIARARMGAGDVPAAGSGYACATIAGAL